MKRFLDSVQNVEIDRPHHLESLLLPLIHNPRRRISPRIETEEGVQVDVRLTLGRLERDVALLPKTGDLAKRSLALVVVKA